MKSPSASSSRKTRPRLLAIFLAVVSSAMSATDPTPSKKESTPFSARRIKARTVGSLSYRSINPRWPDAIGFVPTVAMPRFKGIMLLSQAVPDIQIARVAAISA